MNGFIAAVSLLPKPMRVSADAIPREQLATASEFRLRRGLPPTVLLTDCELRMNENPVTRQDLYRILDSACQSSPYVMKQCVAQGYVIAPGGVRVGVCGQMNSGENGEYTLTELTSLAIRIPRQVIGCADKIHIEPFHSTLILSPPGCGKTTLLRDMIRRLSDCGHRIGLCDERGEVAAVCHGEVGFHVGRCTDVMSGMPKAQSAMAILRSMNPQILAMDEITAPADVEACAMAANCGVQLLATAHAASLDELQNRELYRRLMGTSAFHKIIRITLDKGQRNYEESVL